MLKNNKDVYDFYEENYDEGRRLSFDSLESVRSKEIISRYLYRSNLTIADLAGATGHYSYWLAEQGHDVHLLDLSRKHIEQAELYGKEHNVRLSSLTCGDARKLHYADNEFDLILQMGALYHLQEHADRMECIHECHRVLKHDGVAIFSYISRFASLIDGYVYGFVDDPAFRKIMENDLETGKHQNPTSVESYFTTAFFHTPRLIVEELQQGKFHDVELFSVEGFASFMNTEKIMKDHDKKETLLKHLRATESVEELLGISSHIIAVCVK